MENKDILDYINQKLNFDTKNSIPDEIKEYLGIDKNRQRNLIVKLVKYYIENGKKDTIIAENMKEIYFKQSDIIFYKDIFFEEDNKGLKIQKEIIEKIKEYAEKIKEYREESVEKYLENYKELKKAIYEESDYDKARKIQKEMLPLAEKLHWKYLPIYREIMLKNRGVIPEENLNAYYENYHALEDLYEEIIGKGISWKNLEGDCNLNEKISFKIYSSRWGQEDTYRIERTIFGWEVAHISINGMALKNGYGSLFDNFEHDYIFYPKEGVESALENLWEMADKKEMNKEELESKMQEVADWISDIEKSLRRKQPEWCRYY